MRALLALLLSGCSEARAAIVVMAPSDSTDAHLVLAPDYYVAVGAEIEIFTDPWVLTLDDDNAVTYSYAFTGAGGAAGTLTDDRWEYTPGSAGDLALTVTASSPTRRGSASATLHVVADTVAATKILLVGDSGIDNATFPCAVAAALTGETLIGTQSDGGCANEGRSGRTWAFFATDATSPFVTGGVIDMATYATALGDTPDVVIWYLGVNDIFATGYQPFGDVLEAGISTALNYAGQLIAAMHAQWPNALHAVFTLAPGNDRVEAWELNYDPPVDDPWLWAQKANAYNRLLIQRFGSAPGVDVIDQRVWIDRHDGYPTDNAHHCNSTGYGQSAQAVAGWVKAVR